MRDFIRGAFTIKFIIFVIIGCILGFSIRCFYGDVDFITRIKAALIIGAIVFCFDRLKIFDR
jgi:hypothetical protein